MANYLVEFFTRTELACSSTGVVKFEHGFLEDLVELRKSYAMPMMVTSGCRSQSHNIDVGGHPRSLHMFANPHYGIDAIAIDIDRKNVNMHRLISAALAMGWSVGIAKTFIHLDRRSGYTSLDPNVFTYY